MNALALPDRDLRKSKLAASLSLGSGGIAVTLLLLCFVFIHRTPAEVYADMIPNWDIVDYLPFAFFFVIFFGIAALLLSVSAIMQIKKGRLGGIGRPIVGALLGGGSLFIIWAIFSFHGGFAYFCINDLACQKPYVCAYETSVPVGSCTRTPPCGGPNRPCTPYPI